MERLRKRCNKCGETKPIEEFSKHKQKRGDGRAYRCKVCNREACKKWSTENRERKRAIDREYYSHPENATKVKRRARDYHRVNSLAIAEKLRARAEWRTPEAKARRAVWRSKNQELLTTHSERYRATKVSSDDGSVTTAAWKEVVSCFGGRCGYCLKPVRSPHMDHVIALSRGGKHTIENVVPCCGRCNQSKHNKPVFLVTYLMRAQR